jgi:predicted DNA-binding ribbon-helix-helix protein
VLLKERQWKKEEINPKYPPLHGRQGGFALFPWFLEKVKIGKRRKCTLKQIIHELYIKKGGSSNLHSLL